MLQYGRAMCLYTTFSESKSGIAAAVEQVGLA